MKFGRVTGDLPFACLYHCNSPDFNDSDGILGFGRYVNDARLPAPLFTSLTNPLNLLPGSPQLSPKFRCVATTAVGNCGAAAAPCQFAAADCFVSFLSTPQEAELQIGGQVARCALAAAADELTYAQLRPCKHRRKYGVCGDNQAARLHCTVLPLPLLFALNCAVSPQPSCLVIFRNTLTLCAGACELAQVR